MTVVSPVRAEMGILDITYTHEEVAIFARPMLTSSRLSLHRRHAIAALIANHLLYHLSYKAYNTASS